MQTLVHWQTATMASKHDKCFLRCIVAATALLLLQ